MTARRGFGLAALLLAVALPAEANWVASGRILYEDRDWDASGFTGTTVTKPVRWADIEVVDPTKNGSKSILARGRTDATGSFSIPVTDSTSRAKIRARVLAQTTQTSDLFIKVTSQSGSLYAGEMPEVTNHPPNVNVDFGTLTAPAFGGGEVFNIFDLAVSGADFIQALTGSRPNSGKLVTFRWQIDGGVSGSYTSGNTVNLRDNAGYDDTVILHEWSHYVMTSNYSKSSNPGGTHYLSDCDEDQRLAFDEGRATFFGASVRRYSGFPHANVYIRTSGAPGPGHVENGYDLEDEVQYACDGDTSEVGVSRTLWDVADSASTPDGSPGTDDDPLMLPDLEHWQVFTGPVKSTSGSITHETFWDGWFSSGVANGYLADMRETFGAYGVEFWPDSFEPNDSAAASAVLYPGAAPVHLTFFADPDGDGKGQADTDVFRFAAIAQGAYVAETTALFNGANTKLEILDSNGSTVLASNDDRTSGDRSSRVAWTAPRADTFYVRVTETNSVGNYGSYDLVLTGP